MGKILVLFNHRWLIMIFMSAVTLSIAFGCVQKQTIFVDDFSMVPPYVVDPVLDPDGQPLTTWKKCSKQKQTEQGETMVNSGEIQ